MSEEEIIQEIRDNITDNEGKYMLCDALEDIIKNNNKKYDIQIIVSGLLDLYNKEKLNSLNLSEQLNKEKEKNKKIEDKIKEKIEWLERNIIDNDYASENDKDVAENQIEILEWLI